MLVTLEGEAARLEPLRTRRAFEHLIPALFAARARNGMTLAQLSVQGDHIHMIVEAEDRRSFSRAMQGLCVRIARALDRRGARGRYSPIAIATALSRLPGRSALRSPYVLRSAREHGVSSRRVASTPCSSAAAFAGWHGRAVATNELARAAAGLVVPARSWLLAVGWRRGGGLLDPDDRPGPLPA